MRIRRIVTSALCLGSLAWLGCGTDNRGGNSGGNSGSNDALTDCAGCVGGDSALGAGGTGPMLTSSNWDEKDASSGGSIDAGVNVQNPPKPAVCGNAELEPSEQCDGDLLNGHTCFEFGFSQGQPTCTDECIVSNIGCSGVEACTDNRDNDGDGQVDCADEDCAAACADPCAVPLALVDGQLISGAILQHTLGEASSCASNPTGGGQVAFEYLSPIDGVVEFTLFSPEGDVSLALRDQCVLSNAELSCAVQPLGEEVSFLESNVSEGNTVFALLESPESTEGAEFQLVATAREISCGDRAIDGSEQCDDGNFEPDDGCSPTCEFEPNENEQNGLRTQANPYPESAFVGSIDPANDQDYVSIVVPEGGTLVAETFDMGDWHCLRNTLDSFLVIEDSEGSVVLTDDDGGTGRCAAAVATDLAAGTYYVMVSSAGGFQTFSYRLRLRLL